MAVKIKMRNNKMAVVKFTYPADRIYFEQMMVRERDNMVPHPQIIIKNPDGKDIPGLKKTDEKTGMKFPEKLTPETIAQLKNQQPVSVSPMSVISQEGKQPRIVKPEDVKINVEEKSKSGKNTKS